MNEGRDQRGCVPLSNCDADVLESPANPPPRIFGARKNAQTALPFPGTIRRAMAYVYIGTVVRPRTILTAL
jgi:hypothetical protein